jgi:hypothetical protein
MYAKILIALKEITVHACQRTHTKLGKLIIGMAVSVHLAIKDMTVRFELAQEETIPLPHRKTTRYSSWNVTLILALSL